MLIYAHRGSSGTAPENTLAAFAAGLAAGADGIEFDVHATAEGVPVVIHDRDLSRTTDGHGFVDALGLAQVKELDAGDGQRVPTLAEVLNLAAGKLRLYVELKQAGIEREVLATLGRYPTATWLIGSFDRAILAAVRALAPAAELWPISSLPSDDAFAAAKELGATTISLRADAVTPAVARRFFAADLDLAVWTVNRVAEARFARELGVAALCTDLPATIIDGLAPAASHQRP